MIEKLQIYKDTYVLTNKMYAVFTQMEKCHRHVLGSKMLDCALDLFKWIALANKSRDKVERLKYLDEFLSQFELLRVYLRICSDNKMLKLNTLADLHILIGNISRQLSGWKSATTRM
nr:four helix bundle protein [uncultured Macellibacteroides sp.]